MPITWVFVIQHNEKPSHFEFLHRVVEFFRDQSNPNATRNDTCLVFANTAGKDRPGSCRTHGTSGLVLSPRTPISTEGGLPTFAHHGQLFRRRNEGILVGARCFDFVLRESGECIHSFDQINPSQLQPGPAAKSYAAENGAVHPALGRGHVLAPGTGVAASVKWVNDQLDQINMTIPAHAAELNDELMSNQATVVSALRSGSSKDLEEVVLLATPRSSKDPDLWSEPQVKALSHVVCSLQIVAMGAQMISVGMGKVHGIVRRNGHCFDVMAVVGETHQECLNHVVGRYGRRQRRHLLLVSRDLDNTPWDRREESILRTTDPNPNAERRYTDGRNPSYHVGYQNMIRILGSARTAKDVAEQLNVSS